MTQRNAFQCVLWRTRVNTEACRLDNKLSSVHGLSFSDFMVLHSLARAEGQRLRRIDLAERMGLTASGVTRTLLPLEKIGLVGREADPRDARDARDACTPAPVTLANARAHMPNNPCAVRGCPHSRA